MSGHSDIDRVREETDLVRLIGEHVALRPQGREHVGVCPFHDDHRPSMHVVTHKEHAFYKCFACGAAGDCFRFVMDYHKMDFGEALRYLADRAGVTLRPRGTVDPGQPSRSDLREVTAAAHAFFRRTLAGAGDGTPARRALADRGLTPEMIEAFELGLAPPGFDNYLLSLQGDAARIKQAHRAGLLRERAERGGYYDTFRNRLIFPIFDELGRPIAFGGRVLDANDTPKYLNSPESPLFDKSKAIFGLNLAKRAIIASRTSIVTEGYTDVMACHQAGFTNAVATLGTALTRQHAEVLQRLCDTVDARVRRRRSRTVAPRIVRSRCSSRPPVDVRICSLPDGLDPDDLLRSRRRAGPVPGSAGSRNAKDALAYKLDRLGAQLGGETGISGRQKRIETFLRRAWPISASARWRACARRCSSSRSLADLLRMLREADVERAISHRDEPPRDARGARGGSRPPPPPPPPTTIACLAPFASPSVGFGGRDPLRTVDHDPGRGRAIGVCGPRRSS